jgi:membrane associated rhomboid family serine protease
MGLYDREYYREEHARREAWQIGPVTLGLITVTVLVFFAQLVTIDIRRFGPWSDPLLNAGGFSVDKVLQGEVWRLVTPLFLHHAYDNIWLIAASMIVLAYCGRGIEGTYGPKEMFWFYVFTGLVTQAALFSVSVAKPFQFAAPEPGYGCGGPVAAVMVLYALLAPNDRVPLLIGSVKASTLATIIVLVNLALFAATRGGYFPAVPVLAGAAFGMAYHRFGWRVSNWVPDLPGLRRSRTARSPVKSRPLFRDAEVETPEPTAHPSPRPRKADSTAEAPIVAAADEQLEAELDRVLGKVAKTGRASLTAEENALLLRASEIYKMKRR